MSVHTIGLFAATCFFLSMTPGPNMLTALGLGVRFGIVRAAWGGLGMCLALAALAVLSALGVGALLAASPTAFQIFRWTGVAYLIWLGVQAWRAPPAPARSDAPDLAADTDGAPWRLLLRGCLVTFSNPKALIFMAAFFPQFIDAAAPVAPQLAVLTIAMLVIEFGWIMAYAAGGDRLATHLTGARAALWLNRMTGALLVGAGGLLALA